MDYSIEIHKGVSQDINTQSSRDNSVNTTVDVYVDKKKGSAASWGTNNDTPNLILKAISASGVAKRGLKLQKQTHYGQGVFPCKTTVEGSTRKITPVIWTEIPDISKMLKAMWYKRFIKGIISDFETFAIAFPEYVLSDNYEKILSAKRIPTSWCRFKVEETTGRPMAVLISQNWSKKAEQDESFNKEVALVDPNLSIEDAKEYCKKNKISKFIRPVFDIYNFEAHYPSADWHSVMNNEWLSVASSIPEYKRNMFDNQVNTKYIIEIHEEYFRKIYIDEWELKTVEEKKTIRKELTDAINTNLSGNENAGKSISSIMIVNSKGDTESAIKITPVDNKLKDGVYLPDASAANSEICFAIGVDPSLIGDGVPGGKLGSGSGSDKRVAFNILQMLKKTDRETTLESIEFIHGYNDWDPSIEWKFENTVITTLDENPTSSQNTVDV